MEINYPEELKKCPASKLRCIDEETGEPTAFCDKGFSFNKHSNQCVNRQEEEVNPNCIDPAWMMC
jgi:hypothetical protein